MNISDKKIGIWGFGIVGKSALDFLSKKNNQCQILDNRILTYAEKKLISSARGEFIEKSNISYFLKNNDFIFASPGVDISSYKQNAHFLCELDIFVHEWKKPIIGITGTVGKTTITTILEEILSKRYTTAVGGNIGIPMLDLLEKQTQADLAILELSSWQLEHARVFQPDIAIISNIYPNHLDRHKTMTNYIKAKLNILKNQTIKNIAILPRALEPHIQNINLRAKVTWVDEDNMSKEAQTAPNCTFRQNWQLIEATLDALGLPRELIQNTQTSIPHRLECVGTHNQVTYYNDSKSTTPQSTLAAVRNFENKSILLILGGISKGIDRSTLIGTLPNNIKQIICFGKEAQSLKKMCDLQHIQATFFDNLHEVMEHCSKINAPKDIVLFSPSGASFDLYENYIERGNHFKTIVSSLKKE